MFPVFSIQQRAVYALLKRRMQPVYHTDGAKEEMVKEMGFHRNAQATKMAIARIFGSCESMFVTDTLQFDDYSKYVSTLFQPGREEKHRDEQFPKDCKKAYHARDPAGSERRVRFSGK